MFIEEMKILIDCQRLVENMLEETAHLLTQLEPGTIEYKHVASKFNRLQAALQGKGVIPHEYS